MYGKHYEELDPDQAERLKELMALQILENEEMKDRMKS